MKLLLVTLYFPPAGGGGVQRPLKFASHLPALGIETHVLAPGEPTWVHEVADLRDSIVLHPHRSVEGTGARAKQKARAGIARLVAHQADAIVAASEAIAAETRATEPRGRVVTIANGSDFDDFAGLDYVRRD